MCLFIKKTKEYIDVNKNIPKYIVAAGYPYEIIDYDKKYPDSATKTVNYAKGELILFGETRKTELRIGERAVGITTENGIEYDLIYVYVGFNYF